MQNKNQSSNIIPASQALHFSSGIESGRADSFYGL